MENAMALASNRIDDLDRHIILELQENARRPYKEIAAKLSVSESTVSNRVNRLVRTGILKLEARVDPSKLTDKVAAIIGIKLERRGHLQAVNEIRKIPGVSAVYVATGKYDLFIEVMEDSIADLNDFLFHKSRLSKVKNVIATETFILLSTDNKYFKLA
jgi:Lrp/AsnC family transcriptional regulator for asnA, asnC and gidA